MFDSVAQAVDWYADHARHLRGLLVLASRLDHDTTWHAGVALWSLDRWIGAHQAAVEVQMIGLKAAQRSATLSHRERLLARAEHLARAAISLTDLGRHHAALPLCDEAVDIATLHAHSAAFSDILAARARVRRAVGDTGPALADLHLALEYARDERDRALRHRDRAVLHADLGRYDEALLDLDQATSLMLTAGDDLGHARVDMNRADILVRVDRPGEAAVLLAGALPVIARSGSPLHLAHAQNASGRCAKAMGDLSGAVDWFTAARASYLAARRPDHAHAMHLAMLCCASTTPPNAAARSRRSASLAPGRRDGHVDAGRDGGAA